MLDLSNLFVDTTYVQGLYNLDDQHHGICVQGLPWAQQAKRLFITDAVLCETGNAFSSLKRRARGASLIREFLVSKRVTVIRLSPRCFEQALQLYEHRADKEWGMIDCFSFVVMEKYHLKACLTVDYHFAQAGFKILPF